ncbi:hypothetical protein JRQ81_019096 [Phrynocephalus forsythii]|uniref:Ig-like domain-containing protein n=1 Tax=Phrynocephalus forsythii TaxID=171643 RepID=A0A9Q0XL98_9SAUR|nr:hypothetical protein JRQ81_019096 [Phrynocephalus forsythii]
MEHRHKKLEDLATPSLPIVLKRRSLPFFLPIGRGFPTEGQSIQRLQLLISIHFVSFFFGESPNFLAAELNEEIYNQGNFARTLSCNLRPGVYTPKMACSWIGQGLLNSNRRFISPHSPNS